MIYFQKQWKNEVIIDNYHLVKILLYSPIKKYLPTTQTWSEFWLITMIIL